MLWMKVMWLTLKYIVRDDWIFRLVIEDWIPGLMNIWLGHWTDSVIIPECRWYVDSYLKVNVTSQDTVTKPWTRIDWENRTRVGSDNVWRMIGIFTIEDLMTHCQLLTTSYSTEDYCYSDGYDTLLSVSVLERKYDVGWRGYRRNSRRSVTRFGVDVRCCLAVGRTIQEGSVWFLLKKRLFSSAHEVEIHSETQDKRHEKKL